MGDYVVVVGAGSFRHEGPDAVQFAHRWTDGGVSVDADFTGAHLLHLAAAGCVLNDVYREAEELGVEIDGVRVTASGGFDTEVWHSTGIAYDVEIDAVAGPGEVEALLTRVEAIAEIPRAIRAGAPVVRVDQVER